MLSIAILQRSFRRNSIQALTNFEAFCIIHITDSYSNHYKGYYFSGHQNHFKSCFQWFINNIILANVVHFLIYNWIWQNLRSAMDRKIVHFLWSQSISNIKSNLSCLLCEIYIVLSIESYSIFIKSGASHVHARVVT